MGKVNPPVGDSTIANFTFPPFTLRFDSVDTDWIEVFDPTGFPRYGFITDFVFAYTPGGWYEQVLTNKLDKWGVETVQQFETWANNLTFPFDTVNI